MSATGPSLLQTISTQEVSSALNQLEKRYTELEAAHSQLKQRMTVTEKKAVEAANSLRDECNRERARYRTLEAKMDEFQASTEKAAQRRVEDLMVEVTDLRQELARERGRCTALERELDDISSYASEKLNLTRRLEIAEQRVQELETIVEGERQRFLADTAEQRATLEARHKQELAGAITSAIQKTNENISAETRLLREQNTRLQRSVALMKSHVLPCAAGGSPGSVLVRSDVYGGGNAGRAGALAASATFLTDVKGSGAAGPAGLGGPAASGLSRAALGAGASSGAAADAGTLRSLSTALSQFSEGELNAFERKVDSGLERRVGELNYTIRSLAGQLDQAREGFRKDRQEIAEFITQLVSKFQAERKDLLYEIRSLEKLVYGKCKELFKIRTLAQFILQRRTDLEVFLTKALVSDLGLPDNAVYTMGDMTSGVHESPHFQGARRSPSPTLVPLPMGRTSSLDMQVLGGASDATDNDLPPTVKEMAKALNRPIKIRASPEVTCLTSEAVQSIVRGWIHTLNAEKVN